MPKETKNKILVYEVTDRYGSSKECSYQQNELYSSKNLSSIHVSIRQSISLNFQILY